MFKFKKNFKHINDFFSIKKVDDGILELNECKLSIIKIELFNIVNPDDNNFKIRIEEMYKSFINNLGLQFKIIVMNRKLEIRDFIKLTDTNNEFLLDYYEKIINHVECNINMHNIINETVYFVFKSRPKMNDDDLKKEVQLSMTSFIENGLDYKFLSKDEIIKLINVSLFKDE